MSAILTILGRATRDPEMQQGKNSGTEYVSLDIAVSQRGQDGKEETIYYQCYFNKFLAERLAKAGVKKGTGLMIYGDLELHPFIYQKGKNAGQANAGPRINVKDWHFVPSNRSDSNTGHPGANQNSRMVVRQRPVQPAMAATQCREIPMAATRIRQCLAAIHSREWLLLTVPTRLLQMADSIRLRQTEPVSHRAATRRRAVIPECQITEVCRAVSQLTAFKMCRNRWHPSCPINSQGTLC